MAEIKRFMGKVSDDNPIEGFIEILAKLTGVPASEIELSDEMLAQINRITNEKKSITKIINPFYDNLKSQNTKESNKKLSELITIGMFIFHAGKENEIKIVECGERPDFIVSYQDELIGVELTGLYDDEVNTEMQVLKKLISKCQDEIRQDEPEMTGFFNIVVIPSLIKEVFPFKESEVKKKIIECVKACGQNLEFEKPDFISEIIKSNHATLELALGEDYWLKELNTDKLSERILEKNEKIVEYKRANGIDKCWLLIKIDGTGSASSFDFVLEALPFHWSQFENVFLFDTFKRQIALVKRK